MQIDVPRDRDGSFTPVIVKKRQRRLTGVDEIVLSLTARGLTTGEVAAHFDDVYGASVSMDTISRIADKVIEEMTDWANWPLDSVYPVMFIDALVVKARDGQVGDEKSRKKAADAEPSRFIRGQRAPTPREASDRSRARIHIRLLRRLRFADDYVLPGAVPDSHARGTSPAGRMMPPLSPCATRRGRVLTVAKTPAPRSSRNPQPVRGPDPASLR